MKSVSSITYVEGAKRDYFLCEIPEKEHSYEFDHNLGLDEFDCYMKVFVDLLGEQEKLETYCIQRNIRVCDVQFSSEGQCCVEVYFCGKGRLCRIDFECNGRELQDAKSRFALVLEITEIATNRGYPYFVKLGLQEIVVG